jgi:hypothetical protein
LFLTFDELLTTVQRDLAGTIEEHTNKHTVGNASYDTLVSVGSYKV